MSNQQIASEIEALARKILQGNEDRSHRAGAILLAIAATYELDLDSEIENLARILDDWVQIQLTKIMAAKFRGKV